MFRTLAILNLILTVLGPESSGDYELYLVHVIFRHGERTPADSYPLDPHVNFTFYPVGWGQLTNEGKVQQYLQGQYLRKRYGHFLGHLYSPIEVKFFSSDVDRAKMSAQLNAAGLWPPVGEQLWNPQLKWQPVPIYSEPLNQDKLLLVRLPCPKYHLERQNVMNSEEVKVILEENNATELYKFLENKTGLSFSDPDDVQSLYNTLKAEEAFNLTLPDWTREVYPHKLKNLTVYSFILNAYNTDLQRIKGGPLLKKIINDTLKKINNVKEPVEKMYLYAGHDSTVTNLLLALKVWHPQEPVYNIMTLLEVHRSLDGRRYGIKVFLRNSTEYEPYQLTIPGCVKFCPLEDFIRITRDVVPDNIEQECKVNITGFQLPTIPPP